MESLVFYDYDDTGAEISTLAYGFVAPGSSDDAMLLIYNDSDTYQANDVTVQVTGNDAEQLLVSLDGDAFTVSVIVGDIAPNSGCAPFYLRRVTATTAPNAVCSAVLTATPGSWSTPIDTSASTNIGLLDDNAPAVDTPDDTQFTPPVPPA